MSLILMQSLHISTYPIQKQECVSFLSHFNEKSMASLHLLQPVIIILAIWGQRNKPSQHIDTVIISL